MFERQILVHLIFREDYGKRVLPHLKPEYFRDRAERALFETIAAYTQTYNSPPPPAAVFIDISKRKDLNEAEFREANEFIDVISAKDAGLELEYVVKETEEWCQNRALYRALEEANKIIAPDEFDKKKMLLTKTAIPKIFTDALAISFDTKLGHDWLGDSDERFLRYSARVKRIPFDLEMLNLVTAGGLPPRSLTIFIAGVHIGKSFVLAHIAASQYAMGKNVLYITMEMSEDETGKRIDANLLGVNIEELVDMPLENFQAKMRIKGQSVGKLKIKEYPGGVSTAVFRRLLDEYRIKEGFVPDIVYVDQLVNCSSATVKLGPNVGIYQVMKNVTEELRAIAVEYDLPVVTASQLNRDGSKSGDPKMTDTAESWGIPQQADVIIAISRTPGMDAMSQWMFIQLKNRLRNMAKNPRFAIGVDNEHMRLHDCEQKHIDDSGPKEDKPNKKNVVPFKPPTLTLVNPDKPTDRPPMK